MTKIFSLSNMSWSRVISRESLIWSSFLHMKGRTAMKTLSTMSILIWRKNWSSSETINRSFLWVPVFILSKRLPVFVWRESFNFCWIKRIIERTSSENILCLCWFLCLILMVFRMGIAEWTNSTKISIAITKRQIQLRIRPVMVFENYANTIKKTTECSCILTCMRIQLQKVTSCLEMRFMILLSKWRARYFQRYWAKTV